MGVKWAPGHINGWNYERRGTPPGKYDIVKCWNNAYVLGSYMEHEQEHSCLQTIISYDVWCKSCVWTCFSRNYEKSKGHKIDSPSTPANCKSFHVKLIDKHLQNYFILFILTHPSKLVFYECFPVIEHLINCKILETHLKASGILTDKIHHFHTPCISKPNIR